MATGRPQPRPVHGSAGSSRPATVPYPPSAQRGQGSVELVAILPALAAAVLIAAQMALAGYALWSAGVAARAGARAAHIDRNTVRAARRALPARLRRGARIAEQDGVRVRIRVPTLIPGLPTVGVEARAALGLGDG